jgi:hypothetical protein
MVCQQRCVGGVWGTCLPTGASEEVCGNGIDDNCNNSIDEYCTEDECEGTETEACGGSPSTNLCVRTCQSGRFSACSPNPPNTGEEVCDGQDNDCDGQIDEGDCTCDNGVTMWCGAAPEMHSCHQVCNAGTWTACQPVAGGTPEEECGDGDDNDCDGTIDETEPCTLPGCGEGEARCEGTTRGDCFNASWECAPGDTVNEACDGEDRGICDPGERERTCNSSNCTWNAWGSCTGVVGPASSESCNGLDDDCDGNTDEDVSGSDAFGSNSSQGSCHDLGEDPECDSAVPGDYLYPILEAGGDDWFCFDGDDGSLIGWEDIQITLTNLPGDLDITLYRDDPETGEFTMLAESIGGGTSDEEIEFNEDFGGEDTARYYVHVESFHSSSACYSLCIDGLR